MEHGVMAPTSAIAFHNSTYAFILPSLSEWLLWSRTGYLLLEQLIKVCYILADEGIGGNVWNCPLTLCDLQCTV